jgi:hypothetical protein
VGMGSRHITNEIIRDGDFGKLESTSRFVVEIIQKIRG